MSDWSLWRSGPPPKRKNFRLHPPEEDDGDKPGPTGTLYEGTARNERP
jgi:hypothetical protein